jgi:hypothetical protein
MQLQEIRYSIGLRGEGSMTFQAITLAKHALCVCVLVYSQNFHDCLLSRDMASIFEQALQLV